MAWCRRDEGLPFDHVWRVVAHRTGEPVVCVLGVFEVMLSVATRNNRTGSLDGWEDDIAAVVLDIDEDQVAAIREAMEGLVIADGRLIAWDKYNPPAGRTDASSAV